MAGEWRETTFAELIGGPQNVIGGPFGSNLTQADYTSHGVPVIRGSNMGRMGRYIAGEFAFVSDRKADALMSNQVRPGDIIVTQRGTMGQVSIVPRGQIERFVVSQSQMGVRVEAGDPMFVYYLLTSKLFSNYLEGATIQTGVPHINMGILRSWQVVAPPRRTQELISAVLSSLDDKIELNRRMAATLEDMAQALFKSWFVDFDPVRAKTERCPTGLPDSVAALFPSRFGDDQLPEGWTHEPLSQLAELDRSTIDPALLRNDIVNHYSLPAFDAGRTASREPASEIKSLKLKLTAPIVLFSKLNPDIKRIWLVRDTSDVALASTEFLAFRPRQRIIGLAWLTCLLSTRNFTEKAAGMVTGTSKSHQRVQPDSLMQTTWPLPSVQVLAAFEEMCAPLLERVYQAIAENSHLAIVRDALLPKLISGELRIEDAKNAVEAA